MVLPLPLPGEIVDLEEIAARRPVDLVGVLVGYARVSTKGERQKLDLQMDALRAAGVDPRFIFSDTMSGEKSTRPGLKACLEFMRPGDTLVVWKLDRLSRKLAHIVKVVDSLNETKVGFRSLTETLIDTTSPQGVLLYAIMGALAQFSNEQTRERIKAGLAAAEARGRRGGRPRALSEAQLKAIQDYIAAHPSKSQYAVARDFNIKRNTLVTALRRKKEEDRPSA